MPKKRRLDGVSDCEKARTRQLYTIPDGFSRVAKGDAIHGYLFV